MLRVLAQRLNARSLTLIALETGLIVAAVAIAAYARLGVLAWDVAVYENGIAKALLIAAVTQICLYYTDLYDLRLLSDRRELTTRIAQALSTASCRAVAAGDAIGTAGPDLRRPPLLRPGA